MDNLYLISQSYVEGLRAPYEKMIVVPAAVADTVTFFIECQPGHDYQVDFLWREWTPESGLWLRDAEFTSFDL